MEQPWLMQGDCLERMKEIPDGSVDLILCDLPYGTTACRWDVVLPFEELWKQYWRVLKKNRTIALFGAEPFSSRLRSSQLELFKYDWIWEKNKATGHMQARRKPLKSYEIISVFGEFSVSAQHPPFAVYNPIGLREVDKVRKYSNQAEVLGNRKPSSKKITAEGYPKDILRFAVDEDHLHPTQKPVALLEYLIRTYTFDGETVLDNTMGSGSTGVACVNTGRRFIGVEKDPTYFDVAKERIYQALAKKEELIFA